MEVGGSVDTDAGMGAAYRWLLAWALMILMLGVVSKTRLGHVIIYYSLLLSIVFVLVTQYRFIAQALSPLGQPAPSGYEGV